MSRIKWSSVVVFEKWSKHVWYIIFTYKDIEKTTMFVIVLIKQLNFMFVTLKVDKFIYGFF